MLTEHIPNHQNRNSIQRQFISKYMAKYLKRKTEQKTKQLQKLKYLHYNHSPKTKKREGYQVFWHEIRYLSCCKWVKSGSSKIRWVINTERLEI